VNIRDVPSQEAQIPAPTPVAVVGGSPLRRWVWLGVLAYVLGVVLLALLGVARLVATIGPAVMHSRPMAPSVCSRVRGRGFRRSATSGRVNSTMLVS